MKSFKSNHGYSMIQVLVGAALLGLLGIAFASLIKDMWIENKSLQNKSFEMTLAEILSAQLRNEVACIDHLKNLTNFDPTQKRELQVEIEQPASGAEIIASSGTQLAKWGLKVNALELNEIALVTNISGESTYSGNIDLQIESLTGRPMPYKEKSIGKLFLRVNNATRTIVGCYAVEDQQNIIESACLGLSGQMVNGVCSLDRFRDSVLASIGNCTGGDVLVGVFSDGRKDCQAASNKLDKLGSCPSGMMMMGFNPDGSLSCGAPPPEPEPPAPKVCSTTDAKRGCCPGGGGACSMTSRVTKHDPSGGRGGSDYDVNNYTCFCD